MAYSPVTTWLHRMPEELAEFRRIVLEDGTLLKVTAKHFVYKSDCWCKYCRGEGKERNKAFKD